MRANGVTKRPSATFSEIFLQAMTNACRSAWSKDRFETSTRADTASVGDRSANELISVTTGKPAS